MLSANSEPQDLLAGATGEVSSRVQSTRWLGIDQGIKASSLVVMDRLS